MSCFFFLLFSPRRQRIFKREIGKTAANHLHLNHLASSFTFQTHSAARYSDRVYRYSRHFHQIFLFLFGFLLFFLYSQRGRRRKVIYFVLLFSSFLYYFPFAIPAVHLFFRLNNSNSNNRKADGPLGLFVDNNKSCFPSRRWRKVGASLSCGYWSSTTRWPKMFKKVNLSKTHRLDPSSPPPCGCS